MFFKTGCISILSLQKPRLICSYFFATILFLTYLNSADTIVCSLKIQQFVKGGKMKQVAVLITDLFEDSEYTEPVAAFKASGHNITHIGIKAGTEVKGKKENTPVPIDKAVKDTGIEAFDALLIPGGYSPDKLRVDADAVKFAKDFLASGKPVFTICHGPQLLITADVLKGRTLTGYQSIIQDIKNAGATFVNQEVVEDGNLITSRNPNDLPAFIKSCLARL